MPRTHIVLAAGAAATLVTFGTSAFAHVGGHAADWSDGFAHPFSGLDHTAVIVAIGWAGLARASTAPKGFHPAWVAPALAFLAAMATGALIGGPLLGPNFAEAGVTLSLGLAALALALGARAPLALISAVSVGCGFAHGAIHALEGGSSQAFILGMLAATALLHLLGLGIGAAVLRAPKTVRVTIQSSAAIGLGALMTQALIG